MFLIQSRIYWRGTGQRYMRPILKNNNTNIKKIKISQYMQWYKCSLKCSAVAVAEDRESEHETEIKNEV